jgi:hypothetical protein
MNFDYQDLKFWLEDKDVLPQAYWDALEDYDPDNLNSDQVLSNWLGYDHVTGLLLLRDGHHLPRGASRM